MAWNDWKPKEPEPGKASQYQVCWLTLVLTEAGKPPTDDQIAGFYRWTDEQITLVTTLATHKRAEVTGIPVGPWVMPLDEAKALYRARKDAWDSHRPMALA